jgi:hypothetical protein
MHEKEKKEPKDLNAFLVSYAIGISIFMIMVSRSPIRTGLDGNIIIISVAFFLVLPPLFYIKLNSN